MIYFLLTVQVIEDAVVKLASVVAVTATATGERYN